MLAQETRAIAPWWNLNDVKLEGDEEDMGTWRRCRPLATRGRRRASQRWSPLVTLTRDRIFQTSATVQTKQVDALFEKRPVVPSDEEKKAVDAAAAAREYVARLKRMNDLDSPRPAGTRDTFEPITERVVVENSMNIPETDIITSEIDYTYDPSGESRAASGLLEDARDAAAAAGRAAGAAGRGALGAAQVAGQGARAAAEAAAPIVGAAAGAAAAAAQGAAKVAAPVVVEGARAAVSAGRLAAAAAGTAATTAASATASMVGKQYTDWRTQREDRLAALAAENVRAEKQLDEAAAIAAIDADRINMANQEEDDLLDRMSGGPSDDEEIFLDDDLGEDLEEDLQSLDEEQTALAATRDARLASAKSPSSVCSSI